ncbi:hypothetical protein B0H19DRAFT_1192462 [Mycena capillaripes]|nr:hypothetical protein B0H19DRAFT_1192462 [Mycena capillaripes]
MILVAKKTDAMWDFPKYLRIADKFGVLDLVVCDKDLIRKDYLGERLPMSCSGIPRAPDQQLCLRAP